MLRGSSAVLVDSTIADCTATNSFGGGLLAREANVTLEGGSRIERCFARLGGGALLARDSNVALLNGTIISESSTNLFGGGLHLGSGCTQSATPRAHNTPLLTASPASLGPVGARDVAGTRAVSAWQPCPVFALCDSQVLRLVIAGVDDASCDRQL